MRWCDEAGVTASATKDCFPIGVTIKQQQQRCKQIRVLYFFPMMKNLFGKVVSVYTVNYERINEHFIQINSHSDSCHYRLCKQKPL